MYSFNTLITDYNTPDGLVKMLESLDIITLNHSVRVCEICRIVEKELGYTDTNLSEAGFYHDIGKYFITTKLLNKRGKLNKIERTIIDAHAYLSYKVLEVFGYSDDVKLLALYHHKFEVRMYFEDNIKDFEPIPDIILEKSKVLKTIDIYEALTTDRSYHRGVSTEEAIKVIRETVPDYDERVINILLAHKDEIE